MRTHADETRILTEQLAAEAGIDPSDCELEKQPHVSGCRIWWDGDRIHVTPARSLELIDQVVRRTGGEHWWTARTDNMGIGN